MLDSFCGLEGGSIVKLGWDNLSSPGDGSSSPRANRASTDVNAQSDSSDATGHIPGWLRKARGITLTNTEQLNIRVRSHRMSLSFVGGHCRRLSLAMGMLAVCSVSGIVKAGGPPPVVIDSIAPAQLVQGSVPQPDIQVFGSDFIEGLPSATNRPTVTFRHVDGIAEFSALAWINFAGTMATVTPEMMNLIVAPLGNYDVIVTRPTDGASDTLAAAFTVTDGIDSDGPQLNVRSAWGGPVNDVAIVGDLAYAAIGRRLVVIDLTDEMNPVEIGSLYIPSGVGGVAVFGDYAFLGANKPYRFTVVDISDPTDPKLVGAGQGDTFSRDVHLYGNLAYVRPEAGGVQAFDITSPANVVFLGGVAVGSSIKAITIAGDLLYVGTDELAVGEPSIHFVAFRVFDLAADPLNPPMIGEVQFNASNDFGGGRTHAVAVEGDYAVWTLCKYDANSGTEMLLTLDISNPASPLILGTFDNDTLNGVSSKFIDVALSEGLAYVADAAFEPQFWAGAEGLAIFDIATDPTNPTIISTFKTHGNVVGVEIVGNRAFLRDSGEGLIILDISNPFNPLRLGNYHSPAVMRQMVKSGDLLYVADAWHGFTVLDVSDAAHPEVVSVYLAEHVEAFDACAGTSYPLGVDAAGIYLQDNKIYLAAGHLGLEVIDVANPVNPTFLGAIRISELAQPEISRSKFIGVRVWNDVACIGFERWPSCNSSDGVFLNVNISDPAIIFELGRVSHGWPAASTIEFESNSGAAFLGFGGADFGIDVTIETSDPGSPEILYQGDVPSVADVALDGNILYLATPGDFDESPGLYVQDVTDPANPVLLEHINEKTQLPGGVELAQAYSVAIEGDSLYVIGRGCSPVGGCGQALYMFDISDLASPLFLDFKPYLGGTRSRIAANGQYVYTTNEFAGPNDPSIGLVISEVILPNTADLDGDGVVGTSDLLILFANWGPCPPPEKGDCPADLDGDGIVGTSDLLELFANWG
ncbi:MAG: hypothetical protein IH984_14930 [Planctomycetes bacterium]|nr:hypothetical protein [Planctomycetota bacterium]